MHLETSNTNASYFVGMTEFRAPQKSEHPHIRFPESTVS